MTTIVRLAERAVRKSFLFSFLLSVSIASVARPVAAQPPPGDPTAPWSHYTTTVNRSADGTHGNSASQPRSRGALTRDGRYALFASASGNLTPNDANNLQDVFVKDRQTGAIRRVSVGAAPQPNGISWPGAITPDGRWVVFQSAASNLVANDTNGVDDLFVYDLVNRTTVRVSLTPGRTQTNGHSFTPAISANGRFVAFITTATNMGTSGAPWQLFVHDRDADADGIFDEPTAISITWLSRGVNLSLNGVTENPSISADGRYVAFESDATDLVSGDTNNARDIFVVDRQTNVTRRVNVWSNQNPAYWNTRSSWPHISADGRVVVFDTNSPLAFDDYNAQSDVYAHDLTTGETTLISRPLYSDRPSTQPSVSDDGRYVLFHSAVANFLAPEDWPGWLDPESKRLFVFDRVEMTTKLASVSSPGRVTSFPATEGFISGDGSTVSFLSQSLDPDGPFSGDGSLNAYVSVPFGVTPMGEPPLVIDVPVEGGEGTFTIATTATTGWRTTSSAAWLTATPSLASGSQTVTWHANSSEGPARETTLQIGHVPFTFRQAERIAVTSISPIGGSAGGGEPVTIKGYGFRGSVQVLFGDVPGISPIVVDVETLNVTTPAGTAGTYAPIQVIVDGQVAHGSLSYYYQPPDSTPPVIVGTASGPRSGEWYTGEVRISWSVTDPESLVTSTSGCDTQYFYQDTAGTSFTCTAASGGGTNAQTIVVKHDHTVPSARVRHPSGVYEAGTIVTADYTCMDSLSGVAICNGAVASGTSFTISGTPGMKTFQLWTVDHAGNDVVWQMPYAIATGQCIPHETLPLVNWWSADGLAADMITAQMPLPESQPMYAPGRTGEAFMFDGSSIIEVPNANAGQLTGERTLAMWVKPAAFSEPQALLAGDGGGFMVGLSASHTIRLQSKQPTPAAYDIYHPVHPDEWTHLVVTFVPQGTLTRVTVYRNGAFIHQSSFPAFVNGTSFLIGGLRSTQRYHGLIDELQIFSSALSAQGVLDLYLAGGSGTCRMRPQITWTPPSTMIYGASTLSEAHLNATASVPGTFTYDQSIGTTLPVGTHTLTGTFTADDNVRYPAPIPISATVVVQPAPLVIAANDARMVYRGTMPPLASSTTGFVNGDTLASLSGSLVLNTSAAADSPAGTYAITPSGVSSVNYAITFAPGTLTIDKAPTVARVTVTDEPSIVGWSISFSIAVARTDFQFPGVPDGIVTFSEGGTMLAQRTLVNGAAWLMTPPLAAGTHALEVTYSGSTSYLPFTTIVSHEVLAVAPPATPTQRWDGFITSVHRRADKTKATGSSSSPWYQETVSRDGRFVTFISAAPDLVPGDANGVDDLFVKDRQTNAIVRVSAGPGGVDAAGSHSAPAISADGQHVAFVSTAATLVEGDDNGYADVFVHDRTRDTTVLVSRRSDGGLPNGGSSSPAISADGRFVAFVSSATNMLPNGAAHQVFLHDRDADGDGLFDEPEAIDTIAISSPGVVPGSDGACRLPSISDDGRYVAYESVSSDLAPNDTGITPDVFIYDRVMRDTIRIPLPSRAAEVFMTPRVSGNGRYVAFTTQRSLVSGDTNMSSDVYLYDRATAEITPISLGASAGSGTAVLYSANPSISDDGRYVLFSSKVRTSWTELFSLFAHDRQTGLTKSVLSLQVQAIKSTLSGDGSTFVFESLTPTDGDTQNQVYAAVHLSLAPTQANFKPAGGDRTFTLTTTPVTDWGLAQISTPDWISWSVPENTIGSAVFPYHVDSIPVGLSFRADSIRVAGAHMLVTQVGFPKITNVTPAHGPAEGGTRVRVYGHGFGTPATVMFGEMPGTSIEVLSQVELYVTTPPGVAGTNVPVRVVVDGNEAPAGWSFHYDDATPPIVTGAATGALSANGEWLTGQAQVAWTIVDPESAIVGTSGCEPVAITEDTAGRTFTCSATSEGGTSSASVTVKRDATPPAARVQTPAGIYEPGASVVVEYSCEDALSGVARCEGPIASGATLTMDGAAGTHELEVIAEDRAGHQVTVLAPYAIATGVCIAPATQPLASWWTADQTALEGMEGIGGIEPVTVTYAPGRVGQAFQFDGSSASSVLNFPGYRGDLSGNRSLALWINPAASTSEQPRVFVSRAASYAFALFPDRTLGYRLSDSAAWTRTAVRVEADRWTHLAMVLSVDSGDTQVHVYRDGRLEDTQTIAGSVVTGGDALTFGGVVPAGGTAAQPSFAGLLDELQIFSAPLDAAAVQALAFAGSKGFCRPVAITWSAAPLVYGTPLGAAQLTPTANVPGTFEFTPAAGAVLAAGEHMLNVTFTPADATTYGIASAKTTVQVTPAALTIRAVDVMQPFGAPIPAFAAVGEGFVNGDTLASLSGTLSFATTATSTSPVGTYPIVPSDVSSPNYAITWAPGTLTIQQAGTATTVTASSSPSGLNEPVTFTARVAPVAPGAGVPAGTIAFSNGATLLGRVALVNGEASLTTGGLGSGTKTITAQYEGDPSFLTSAATLSHIVATSSQSTSTTLTASPNPASVGQTITLSASVSRSAGAVTGMVRFFDGDTLLGESAIASGVARLTIATLAAGPHGISAMYVGAPNVPASRSAVVAVRVGGGGSRTPSLSWSVTPSTGAFGAESTFRLQIARSLGTSPTGWVQFSIDGLPPDPAHRVNVQTNGTSASTATLSLSTLPRGTHKITALYSGDGTFRPGASVVTHVIQ